MVFFVCESCNETLKKNQVERHLFSCRSCRAVTCVDCSVTFYGSDYAGHVTCISEAEKYEKSLYKPKQAKAKPQDIWVALIEEVVSLTNEAPHSIRPFLNRLSSLANVPRNKKKFINFAKNSLNLKSDSILEDLWNFLDSSRQKREASLKANEEPKEVESNNAPEPIQQVTSPAVVQEETEENKSEKKSKKKKREREDSHVVDVSQETEETKSKKQKKEKSKSRHESVVREPVSENEIFNDCNNLEGEEKEAKKEKKVKKEKKHKKERDTVSSS